MIMFQTRSSPMYASNVVVQTDPTAVTIAELDFQKVLYEDMRVDAYR